MLLCIHISGSGFRANATTVISLHAEPRSSFRAVNAPLSLSLLYHLSRFPKSPPYHSPDTHTHTYTHSLTLFQEYWSIISWFWSHLTCLIGLSGEAERKSKKKENWLVRSVCTSFFFLLSNPTSTLTRFRTQICRTVRNRLAEVWLILKFHSWLETRQKPGWANLEVMTPQEVWRSGCQEAAWVPGNWKINRRKKKKESFSAFVFVTLDYLL